MIYFEIQLDSRVNVLDLSDQTFLFRAQIEAAAEALPVPRDLTTAHDYIRSRCYQFELFDSLDEAEAWAERYIGFRAGEIRAALRRYTERRAERFLAEETDNAACGQDHKERAARYA